RYYLVHSINTGNDADFSEELLIADFNSDLANGVGNLVSRTLPMIERYRGGVIRAIDLAYLPDDAVQSHLRNWSGSEFASGVKLYTESFLGFRPNSALGSPLARVLACNALVEISEPWKLAKDELRKQLLDA